MGPGICDKNKLNNNKLTSLKQMLTGKNMVIKTDENGQKYIYQNGKKTQFKIVNLNQMNNSKFVDNVCQTDCISKCDKITQTDNYLNNTECNSPLNDLYRFLLDDSLHLNDKDNFLLNLNNMKKTNNTREEITKFNFFLDLNNCLKFNQAGNLPIHESVLENNLKLLKKNCVVLKARQETPNIYNRQYFTPLHLAILNDGNVPIISELLENEADITQTDTDGNSSLHLAVLYNRYELLKLLLGNAVYKKNRKISLDLFNYDGFTPLMISCMNGHYEITLLLLEYGASPNLRDKKSGKTALFHAAETNYVNVVQLLMDYKADTKIRNFFGTSPHDAMFEIDSTPIEIKTAILGKEHISLMRKVFNRKKNENNDNNSNNKEFLKSLKNEPIEFNSKKVLKTTPILKRIYSIDGAIESVSKFRKI